MTNFEKFRNDLSGILASTIGVSEGRPHPCTSIKCGSCEFVNSEDCADQATDWLSKEVSQRNNQMTPKEAAKLTEYAFDAWEDEYGVGDDWSDEHKARDMAIEALVTMKVICDAVEGFKKKTSENEWRY